MAKKKKRKLQQGTRDYATPRDKVTLQGMNGPVAASQWDMGPSTALQQRNKVIEQVTLIDDDGNIKPNPNNVKRSRRVDVIEKYENERYLTIEQAWVAREMREAHLKGMLGGGSFAREMVDETTRGAEPAMRAIHNVTKVKIFSRMVPESMEPVVRHVVLDDRDIEDGLAKTPMERIEQLAKLSCALWQIYEELRRVESV